MTLFEFFVNFAFLFQPLHLADAWLSITFAICTAKAKQNLFATTVGFLSSFTSSHPKIETLLAMHTMHPFVQIIELLIGRMWVQVPLRDALIYVICDVHYLYSEI